MNLNLWLRIAGYSILVLMLLGALWVNHELGVAGKECNAGTQFAHCP
jgi:hypothetical protein